MTPAPAIVRSARLIGAPSDLGAGTLGARLGPDALRVAGLADAIARYGVSAMDGGNLAGPQALRQPPVDGYRNLHEVARWNQLVHDAVREALSAGHLPILLGGDHSLAIGSISAVARHCKATGRNLRVLWFDAHADFNTAALTPTGNIHGMPVACLCGYGPSQLIDIGGPAPAISPGQIRQIGIRCVDPGEKQKLHDIGVDVFDMRYIDQHGMSQTIKHALDGIDADTHLHISLDVDFLDPSIAPGTGTPVRGGADYREAQLAMELIADTGRLGSLDIVEVNPTLDTRNQTAELAVQLVESLLGKTTLMRWPDSPTN